MKGVLPLVLCSLVLLSGCVLKAELNPSDDLSDSNDVNVVVLDEPQTSLAVIGTPSSELKDLLDGQAAKGENITFKVFETNEVGVDSLKEYNEILVVSNPVTRGVTEEISRRVELGASLVLVRDAAYTESEGRYAWDVLNANGNYLPVQTLGRIGEPLEYYEVIGTLQRSQGTSDREIFAGYAGSERDWNIVLVQANTGVDKVGFIATTDEGLFDAVIVKRNISPAGATAWIAFQPEESEVVFLNLLASLK